MHWITNFTYRVLPNKADDRPFSYFQASSHSVAALSKKSATYLKQIKQRTDLPSKIIICVIILIFVW